MQPSVLIVDDEMLIRENLAAYLEDEEMDVMAEESREGAIALVEAGRLFDVCIMDLRLPSMEGNTAILKLHRLCPTLAFIIHTGLAGYSLPSELRAIGITDKQVFMKPLDDMAVLVDAIRSLCKQRLADG